MAPCELQMMIIHTDSDRFPLVALSEKEWVSYALLYLSEWGQCPKCPDRVQAPQKEMPPAPVGLSPEQH